jgi:hypothetical protein
MTAAEQDWVQQSLSRLEQLETQRMQLEAQGPSDALAEIDEEIASLYEVLESVADDPPSDAAANPAMAAVPMAAPAAAMAAPAPFGVQAPPLAAPMSTPFAAGPAMAEPSSFGGGYDASYDDDVPKSKTGLILGIVAVLVVGAGVAGFMVTQKEEAAPAEAAPSEPGKVLQAGAIPDDTSEPQVAKGADADRSRGTEFKEGSSRASAPAPRSGSSNKSSRSSSRSKSRDKSDDRAINVKSSKNDPLAGVD